MQPRKSWRAWIRVASGINSEVQGMESVLILEDEGSSLLALVCCLQTWLDVHLPDSWCGVRCISRCDPRPRVWLKFQRWS